MRPSNGEVAKAVAGEVLAEVFAVLSQMNVPLGTAGMRTLIDRVETRLQRLSDERRSKPNE